MPNPTENLKNLANSIEEEKKSSNSVNRREFLEWMGALVALMGAEACTKQPVEKILPYSKMPEDIIPGKPLFYATAVNHAGAAAGILVESHVGRPTKVDGNALHPASLGATNVFAQAAVYDLYDPNRSRVIQKGSRILSTAQFTDDVFNIVTQMQSKQGSNFRVVTDSVISPSLQSTLEQLKQKFPKFQWYQYSPMTRDNYKQGTRLAFGSIVDTVYSFDKAKRVVSFDADFLASMPGHLRYARDFMQCRHVENGRQNWNRLYSIESTPQLTGATADHRLAARVSQIEKIVKAVAQQSGIANVSAPKLEAHEQKFVSALLKDVKEFKGQTIFVAGDNLSPASHYLVHGLNHVYSAPGKTLKYIQPIEQDPSSQIEGLQQLVREIQAGVVDNILFIDCNPVYTAPAELEFSTVLARVKNKFSLGLFEDETSKLCDWHIPMSHTFETWGDAKAFDGTVTIQQPLIAPLYQSKSAIEVLSLFLSKEQTSYQIVQDYWKKKWGSSFDSNWKKSVHDGVAGVFSETRNVSFQQKAISEKEKGSTANKMELMLTADPHVYDGRYANNGWLQELPKPFSKLTWDNAIYLSPATAKKLQVENEDILEIRVGKKAVEGPVWIIPSHPEDSMSLFFGYGRRVGGVNAIHRGYNAYNLRTSDFLWNPTASEVKKVSGKWPLACTQKNNEIAGRDLVRKGNISQFEKDPSFLKHAEHVDHDNPSHQWVADKLKTTNTTEPHIRKADYQWGMAINLSTCIGCNACTIACMSENNIAIVGKDQVRRGRDLHWIRIDNYYDGTEGYSQVHFQPVPCMHCETAPCEVVCPVAATAHSDEGLNDMVYNRCVGTKYCSNNCPYKVRRFNFYQYTDAVTPTFKMMRNPDVTVRSRGVMEKCTYCVQRINQARISAEKESRKIRDGEIITACQSVCPTESILFGDVSNPESRVSKVKAIPLNYGLLEDLGTRPRTTYLAKLKNPNPELSVSGGLSGH
jgi:molybdopterin-containing oxidoreductase family iron-sulfur binding subunit